jgi:predicted aminopeptidase
VRSRLGAASSILLLLLSLLLSSCEVSYYWQAAAGQWDILSRRRPIDEELEDPAVPNATKAKLRLVREVQEFGVEHMQLTAKGRYTKYADLGRPQVTWLVVASEPYQFKAVEHCFFIAGCFDYKGYFAKEDADAFAAKLAADGKDVLVRAVRAYSTLGWFDDPVLNTFLQSDELELLGTVLHEQAHRAIFVKNDTPFNEGYAEFVEAEGVREYLEARGEHGSASIKTHQAHLADAERFHQILLRGRKRLEELYESGKPEPELRVGKARLLDAMRQDYQAERNSFIVFEYDGWFARSLNNADLLSVEQYQSRVPAFAALFRENGNDFAKFLDAVRILAKLPPEKRNERLDELEKSS